MPNDVTISEQELKPRQRIILKVLVQEYIDSASPVGSHTIQEVSDLGVSSATIRSEVSSLEEDGYLYQPYTSAGRVPTVKGYRYFVEHLMDEVDLPLPERRTIGHQFHQIRLNLDQWMSLTAAVLAHTTRSASLVTPPHAKNARFKHVELIAVNETICLMILVLEDSSIHQEMLAMTRPIDQARLSCVSNELNALLDNLSAPDIDQDTEQQWAKLSGLGDQVLQRVVSVMKDLDRRSISEIYRDGMVNIFGQPEFDDVAKIRRLLEIQRRHNLLEPILAGILNSNGIQVIIGGEGQYEGIDDVSLVLSRYGIRGRASGVLGIMGPRRMAYARAISTVRYVADLMDSLMTDVYIS